MNIRKAGHIGFGIAGLLIAATMLVLQWSLAILSDSIARIRALGLTNARVGAMWIIWLLANFVIAWRSRPQEETGPLYGGMKPGITQIIVGLSLTAVMLAMAIKTGAL